jgi:hypothetical protein
MVHLVAGVHQNGVGQKDGSLVQLRMVGDCVVGRSSVGSAQRGGQLTRHLEQGGHLHLLLGFCLLHLLQWLVMHREDLAGQLDGFSI